MVLAGSGLLFSQGEPPSRRTVWDGVFNQAQAKRGEETYGQICIFCHQPDLQGGGAESKAPAITGTPFQQRWRDRTIGEMFDKIRGRMPLNDPAGLTAQQYIDIIAFILSKNGMPAGGSELLANTQQLSQIFFTDKDTKPQKKQPPR